MVCCGFGLLFNYGCERELDELEPATFPSSGEVFFDGFPGGLNYAAFGGSVPTAFEVDTEIKFDGTASMRFGVPDFEDPRGAYAGGTFFLDQGRNLTGFNTISFYARATQAANIDVIGFGNDLAANAFQTAINGLAVTTNWQKYYIPIPDPAKLTVERGLFFYSEGPENQRGYTFWIDEVQFENNGEISKPTGLVFGGQVREVSGEAGNTFSMEVSASANLPTGVDQVIIAAPAYFDFVSSDPRVATVAPNGTVTVQDTGVAVITATLGGEAVAGSLRVNATGAASSPQTAAPIPTQAPEDVISIYSDFYQNEPIDFLNGFWEGSTTQSEELTVAGDGIVRYSQMNFVGIQFTSPVIDVSGMTNIRLDIWTPDATDAGQAFRVKLFDVGPDASFGTGDDIEQEITLVNPQIQSEEWVSLDLPLSRFPGITNGSNLAQVVLSGDLPNVYVSNIFFYNDGGGGGGGTGGGGADEPMVAAPTPTRPAADVISLFSEAYDDVAVDTWRTEWSMADFSDVMVAGNAVKRYDNLDFAGVETTMSLVDAGEMTHFHIDVWSPNITDLGIKLVDFGANGAFDESGGDDVEHQIDFSGIAQGQWVSYDLPLADFSGLVSRDNLAQYIFAAQPSGGATLFIDNVYFYRESTGGGGTEPTMAAPTPTRDAANVISLFSDAYSDVTVDTWRTDWSSADFTDIMVAGNAVKFYENLDFVGVETTSALIDAGEMTHFHFDVWTPNATQIGIKLVDFGANRQFDENGGDDVEHQVDFPGPAQGQWISYDIPLADFTGLLTRGSMAQYIFVGQPVQASSLYIDNVYFYKE